MFLKVTPLQGIALETLFTFSTKRSEQSEVSYSFGFYSASGQPFFFSSSAYSSSTQATLPACKLFSYSLTLFINHILITLNLNSNLVLIKP